MIFLEFGDRVEAIGFILRPRQNVKIVIHSDESRKRLFSSESVHAHNSMLMRAYNS